MLHRIYVKNLALIDEIEIELTDGLNILTGETGAGKSIILGSVYLALGGRYSSDILRNEEDAGYVELTFFVDHPEQQDALRKLDVFAEDGVVTLSRKMIGKRSISKVNGESVSVALLKDIASILIDIYGQHEHQSLLYKKHHLHILDAFAKDSIKDIKSKISQTFKEYQSYKEELEHAKLDEKERTREANFLEFEIQEIEYAKLCIGEDTELEDAYRRMIHGKKIISALDEVTEHTAAGTANASDLLSHAISSLQDISRYDDKIEEFYAQLSEIDTLLNDFNREIAGYYNDFEFSDQQFYEVEQRLNEVNRLKAKYGNQIEDILLSCTEKKEELERLRNYDIYFKQLTDHFEESKERLATLSNQLSELRKDKAKELVANIKMGLFDLNFLDVAFDMAFTTSDHYTASGIDEVEFMISMNPGEPMRPLADVASGGELSRIMLAIKTVLADKDDVETLIFDEIDAGISGRTAQKVSEKMAYISKKHQVICITHLAQIAAMADAHYAIEKQVVNGKTKTTISLLNRQEEIAELARIIGGAEITETVWKSATEMKELARNTK